MLLRSDNPLVLAFQGMIVVVVGLTVVFEVPRLVVADGPLRTFPGLTEVSELWLLPRRDNVLRGGETAVDALVLVNLDDGRALLLRGLVDTLVLRREHLLVGPEGNIQRPSSGGWSLHKLDRGLARRLQLGVVKIQLPA